MLSCQMSLEYNVQPSGSCTALSLLLLYQLGHIGCDNDLVKVTIARFPDMDFTVLLVGVVALHRVPVSVAVLSNVVSVLPFGFRHSAQSGISYSRYIYEIYNDLIFHVKNLEVS